MAAALNIATSKSFKAEYASSNRSSCQFCRKKIDKGALRIGVVIMSPDGAYSFPQWHCFEAGCFKENVFDKYHTLTNVNQVSGISTLKFEDQQKIKALILSLGAAAAAAAAGGGDGVAADEGAGLLLGMNNNNNNANESQELTEAEKEAEKLSKAQWALREQLSALTVSELQEMLDENDQPHKGKHFGGKEKMLDRIAEGMMFGALPLCPTCNGKTLAVAGGGRVVCKGGFIDEFARCEYLGKEEEDIKRAKWEVPSDLKDEYDFLEEWKFNKKLKKPAAVAGAVDAAAVAAVVAAKQQLNSTAAKNTISTKDDDDDPFAMNMPQQQQQRQVGNSSGTRRGRDLEDTPPQAPPRATPDMPLAGVAVATAGTLKRPKDVEKLVRLMGGAVVTDMADADVCVMTAAEASGRGTERGKSAVDGKLLCVSEGWLAEVETAGHVVKKGPNVLANEDKNYNHGVSAAAPFGDSSSSSSRRGGTKSSNSKKKKSAADGEEEEEEEEDVAEAGKVRTAAAAADAGEKKKGGPTLISTGGPGGSTKQKLKVVGGNAVDPDSNLDGEVYSVTVNGVKKSYTATLSLTDVTAGVNSFYVVQCIKVSERKFYCFRKWGRVSFGRASTKVTEYTSGGQAVAEFEEVFLKQTGNEFSNIGAFQKKPGKYALVMTDFSGVNGSDDDSNDNDDDRGDYYGPLDAQTVSLVRLLFDMEVMRRELKEMEIDTEKMPLGKLSHQQIKAGMQALQDAQKLIAEPDFDAAKSRQKIVSVTNRFYSLIPHALNVAGDGSCGTLPFIDNADIIKQKQEMLDSLEHMCIATSLRARRNSKNNNSNKKNGDDEDNDAEKHPVDVNYEKLRARLETVSAGSEEFKRIETYLHNTHASTHSQYTLQLDGLWRVEREGELDRFKEWRKRCPDSRELLWHGSRLSNWASILSTGLRIAPPEAPSTGYMLGKGIYSANCSSKSANYCYTTSKSTTGLLALNEVAVGRQMMLGAAKYVEDVPSKKYDSVFGVGKMAPDPKDDYYCDDGVVIPMGKLVQNPHLKTVGKTTLLYDEKVIYSVDQIRMRYVLRLKFVYNCEADTFH